MGNWQPEWKTSSFRPSSEWGHHWVTGTMDTGSDHGQQGQEDTLHPRGHGKHLLTPMHTPSTSETEERSP